MEQEHQQVHSKGRERVQVQEQELEPVVVEVIEPVLVQDKALVDRQVLVMDMEREQVDRQVLV